MATTIPTAEPRSFVAGATVQWTKSLTDYPASEGWILKYFLRGLGDPLNIVCITDPDDPDGYLATIAAADGAELDPGEYTLQGQVSKGVEKYIVVDGRKIQVRPNLEEETNAYDGRSISKRIVDAIDAYMLALETGAGASAAVRRYKIADRELERYEHQQLKDLRTYYWNIYVSERRGGSVMRNINCGF